jgi:hypothetical protein
MNTATVTFEEKNIRQGGLKVNNFFVMFGYDWVNKVYQTNQLANDWNMSNRLMFQARSLKQLVTKIEKHEYTLVKN